MVLIGRENLPSRMFGERSGAFCCAKVKETVDKKFRYFRRRFRWCRSAQIAVKGQVNVDIIK